MTDRWLCCQEFFSRPGPSQNVMKVIKLLRSYWSLKVPDVLQDRKLIYIRKGIRSYTSGYFLTSFKKGSETNGPISKRPHFLIDWLTQELISFGSLDVENEETDHESRSFEIGTRRFQWQYLDQRQGQSNSSARYITPSTFGGAPSVFVDPIQMLVTASVLRQQQVRVTNWRYSTALNYKAADQLCL